MSFDMYSKGWHWDRLENKIKNIKNDFELCIVNLRMCGYTGAYVHINGGSYKENGKRIKVQKCHIYLKDKEKIFTFYCDLQYQKMFYRYKQKPFDTSHPRFAKVHIDNINQLRQKLLDIVLEV